MPWWAYTDWTLLNVCVSLATLPFFLALALVQRERRPAFALAALAMATIGTAILGICGTSIMLLYLVVVTFLPGLERAAMVITMIGGVATLVWIVLASLRLIGLGMPMEKRETGD